MNRKRNACAALRQHEPESGIHHAALHEMPGPGQLLRAGMKRDSMKAGDLVTVDARRARDGGNRANAQTVVLTSTGQRLFGAQAR